VPGFESALRERDLDRSFQFLFTPHTFGKRGFEFLGGHLGANADPPAMPRRFLTSRLIGFLALIPDQARDMVDDQTSLNDLEFAEGVSKFSSSKFAGL
jgi:hypothetical protein